MAAQQTERIKIAIPLYRHRSAGAEGSFHVALLAQRDDLPFSDPVKVYQISNWQLDPGTDGITTVSTVPWHVNHRENTRLLETSTLMGCVVLGRAVDCTLGDFDSLIKTVFPAEQVAFRLPPHQSWNCAWWTFRCVESLNDMVYLDLEIEDPAKVYQRVIALGAQLNLHSLGNLGKVVLIDFKTAKMDSEAPKSTSTLGS